MTAFRANSLPISRGETSVDAVTPSNGGRRVRFGSDGRVRARIGVPGIELVRVSWETIDRLELAILATGDVISRSHPYDSDWTWFEGDMSDLSRAALTALSMGHDVDKGLERFGA